MTKHNFRTDHPEYREVSEDMLADKQAMCEEYLRLLDKVEPGMSKNRGEEEEETSR